MESLTFSKNILHFAFEAKRAASRNQQGDGRVRAESHVPETEGARRAYDAALRRKSALAAGSREFATEYRGTLERVEDVMMAQLGYSGYTLAGFARDSKHLTSGWRGKVEVEVNTKATERADLQMRYAVLAPWLGVRGEEGSGRPNPSPQTPSPEPRTPTL